MLEYKLKYNQTPGKANQNTSERATMIYHVSSNMHLRETGIPNAALKANKSLLHRFGQSTVVDIQSCGQFPQEIDIQWRESLAQLQSRVLSRQKKKKHRS